MQMHKLIEHLQIITIMTDFNGANNTGLFNFKEKVTDQINADGAKNVEIAAPLKY